MNPNEFAVERDAAILEGMIQVELLTLMSHAVTMGNHLRHAGEGNADRVRSIANRVGLSDGHAALLIVAAERAAKHRSEGCTQLSAIELLCADRELVTQVLEHTSQAVKGAH